MKSHTNSKLTLILMIVGILLVCASAFSAVFSVIIADSSAKTAKERASELRSLMPEVYAAVPDERKNTAMPMLELDGDNFIGILEIPLYDTSLPIRADWDTSKLSKYPCRYTGSAYDNTLIIGGRDTVGQLDFSKNISIGDEVFVTDVSGAVYSYTVSRHRANQRRLYRGSDENGRPIHSVYQKHLYSRLYTYHL